MGSLAFPSAKTPGLLVRAHASRPRNEQGRAEASNTALTMTVSTSSESRRPDNSLCSFLHLQMLHDAPSIGCYGGVKIYAALALGCAQRSAFTLGHTPHNVTPLNVWKEVRLGRGLDPDLRGRARASPTNRPQSRLSILSSPFFVSRWLTRSERFQRDFEGSASRIAQEKFGAVTPSSPPLKDLLLASTLDLPSLPTQRANSRRFTALMKARP